MTKNEKKLPAMNKQKMQKFAALVERQRAGDAGAIQEIRALRISLDDGYCLGNLYGEWRQAFGYKPGRAEALPAICALAKRILNYKRDDTGALFNSNEWGDLVDLRGPVECVTVEQCTACQATYTAMGTSGFYDAIGYICPGCGNVYFHNPYSETPVPKCACGKKYKRPVCPDCGKEDSKLISGSSPYEYFATHSFIRGPDA